MTEPLIPGAKFPITGFFIGKLIQINGRPSGYGKTASPPGTVITINKDGIVGDEHTKIHGGPDRVINHYNANHYTRLIKNFPRAKPTLFVPGFGENISTGTNTDGLELNENNVCIGDVFRLGTVLLQVCQPREPCSKVDKWHKCTAQSSLKNYLVKAAMTGWFYRVLEEGVITIGDNSEIEFVSRINPEWPLARIVTSIQTAKAKSNSSPEFLSAVLGLDELAYKPWKQRVEKWLENKQ